MNYFQLNKASYLSSKVKMNIYNLIFNLIWWNVFIHLFISLRFLGSIDSILIELEPKSINFFKENMLSASVIVSIFAIIEWFFDSCIIIRLFRNKSIGIHTIRRILTNLISFIIVGALVAIYYYSAEKGMPIKEVISELDNFFINSVSLYFFIVITLISLSLILFQSVQRNLGWSNLISLIIGKYQNPKEEDRIFVFVDLVSSTSVAERLGHKAYSSFIQECFRQMSNSILRTNASVYQFVGDEAVLTWKSKYDVNYLNATDFFFLFQEDLEKKRDYFESEFGFMPQFTASINSGNIMVAEVGEIKNAIAYHGDVLNTAARIQKKCKQYESKILATARFTDKLNKIKNGYIINFIDEISLSGKNELVKIFSINTKQQFTP